MLIAIDFDETLTADAALWRMFLEGAAALGHRVVCVTARRDTEDNRATLSEWMESHGIELTTYFTGLGSKVEFMKSRGLDVKIWIEDDPRKCALGH
jgi:hypothetical protein